MRNHKKIAQFIGSLVMASCFMMVQQTVAQYTWSDSKVGFHQDRFTVNDNNSDFWSSIRLQAGQTHGWNMMNQKDLLWSFTGNGLHLDNGTERMRLTTAGRLGIGTSAPDARLHVVANENQLIVEPASSNSHDAVAKLIGHRNENTTDNAAQLLFQNFDHDNNVTHSMGMIAGKVTDDVANVGDLVFYNYLNGTSPSETMRLTRQGNVGIGTETPSNATGWGKVLDVHHGAHAKILATTATNDVKAGIFSHSNWYPDFGPMGVVGTESFHDLVLMAGNNGHHVTVKTDGKIGIGTRTPSEKLTLFDGEFTLHTDDNTQTQGLSFKNSGGSYTWRMYRSDAGSNYADLKFATGLNGTFDTLQDVMVLQNTGNVGIANMNPTEKLDVTGNVKSDGVITGDILANTVTLNIGTFPDYVFADDYRLMPLKDVERYINTNKHLPGFPSEAEVVKTGANLGQINNLLVEKVEELTLYTIDQEKQIDKLSAELEALKAQLNKLLEKQ